MNRWTLAAFISERASQWRLHCHADGRNLLNHLQEIDRSFQEYLNRFVTQMAEKGNVSEALKAADRMEWVHRMNSIHNRAEEIVLQELVYMM